MKRFYKTVATQERDGAWQVTLDGRGIKTVKGAPQLAPTLALAQALAKEWSDQGETLDPARFGLRDMTDYALDIVPNSRETIADTLVAYADTDTLLYRAEPDEPLFAEQNKVWEPIVQAFEAREGIALTRVSGIIHAQQSAQSLAHLRGRLDGLDPFVLAGLEAMTNLAASLTIGLSAIEAQADAQDLWRAACLEEEWQADLWGRDEEAEERRAKRESDFLRAREFVHLAAG